MTKVSGGVHREGRRGRALGRGLTCARPQLCAEDVKDFLEHMAVVRINKGWEFLLPCDAEFVRKHPDVVQRQHMLWTGIQAKYEPVGGAAAAGHPAPRGVATCPLLRWGQAWNSPFFPGAGAGARVVQGGQADGSSGGRAAPPFPTTTRWVWAPSMWHRR